MTNIFEMMLQAQRGHAMESMARQFGLAPDQVQAAVAALMPAFQLGLQRQAESVEGFQRMMGNLAAGRFANLHDADATPDAWAEQGRRVVDTLFGNKQLSDAVAAQASMMSGISDAVMKQMLPAVAGLFMGGLAKGAMQGGFGGLFGQQGGPNSYAEMMGRMMGGTPAPAQNPMADFIKVMFGGMAPQAATPEPQNPMSAGVDMWKGMMASGQQAQMAQIEAFRSIFDRFSGKA